MTVQISNDDGSPVDASFQVAACNGDEFAVLLESRGGTRGTPAARNTEYGRGLQLLLERMGAAGAELMGVVLDSRATADLPEEARRLDLSTSYPIGPEQLRDGVPLARDIGRAQAAIGRAPGSQGSGNSTRRIRLEFRSREGINQAQLEALIASGTLPSEQVESADDSLPGRRPLELGDLPQPDADLGALNDFAHTFNGYQYAGSFDECVALHEQLLQRFVAGLPFEGSSDDLRAALFLAFRAERHGGYPMGEDRVSFVRALVEELHKRLNDEPSARTDLDTHYSSYREKMLEHVFVSELLQEAWFRNGRTIEVLRSEVDSEGYDLVVEFNGVLRHVQLKSSHASARTARQTISVKLANKPNGCVVWLVYRQNADARVELTYRFFGGAPGAGLPSLGDAVVRHTKGDASGVKKERPGFRAVNKGAFSTEMPMQELFYLLFG